MDRLDEMLLHVDQEGLTEAFDHHRPLTCVAFDLAMTAARDAGLDTVDERLLYDDLRERRNLVEMDYSFRFGAALAMQYASGSGVDSTVAAACARDSVDERLIFGAALPTGSTT